MLLGILGTLGLLWSLLASKCTVTAGKGTIRAGEGIIRAGQDF